MPGRLACTVLKGPQRSNALGLPDNRLHWIRDVTFAEDLSQIRSRARPREHGHPAQPRASAFTASPAPPTSPPHPATSADTPIASCHCSHNGQINYAEALGYHLADGGPHPNPAKAADGRRLHVLEPGPVTAPIVRRIFAQYLAGTGLFTIAEGLTRDGVLSPSAADWARNRHRSTTAWSKGAVRVILTNPRFTGRQVWNKQRKDEVLIDIEDVALGRRVAYALERAAGVGVVDRGGASTLGGRRGLRSRARDHRRSWCEPYETGPGAGPERPYVLRGLVHCGVCLRKMQSQWTRNQACATGAGIRGSTRWRTPSSARRTSTCSSPR